MKAINLGVLVFCAFGIISCDSNDDGGRTVTDYKEYVLTVASKKVPGDLLSDGHRFLSEVYAVKEGQSDGWSACGYIDGFEYEKGYEYRIKISETSYLDWAMGDPAWTERDLIGVISKDKKDSENLPSHFIPATYYDNVPLPQYRYMVDADNKELIEEDLKGNSLIPLDYHAILYRGEDKFLKWIALKDNQKVLGPYIIQTKNKAPEEMPESYKNLPPEAQIVGYGEWIFLDEALDAIDNFSFDVFIGYATVSKSDRPPVDTIYLYKDLTEHYQTEYPDAGVKTVVISYAGPSMM